MTAPEPLGLWTYFLTKKRNAKISPVLRETAPGKNDPDSLPIWVATIGAVPLYVEQGSLLYRTGQQFSKSSLGRLETDQSS